MIDQSTERARELAQQCEAALKELQEKDIPGPTEMDIVEQFIGVAITQTERRCRAEAEQREKASVAAAWEIDYEIACEVRNNLYAAAETAKGDVADQIANEILAKGNNAQAALDALLADKVREAVEKERALHVDVVNHLEAEISELKAKDEIL